MAGETGTPRGKNDFRFIDWDVEVTVNESLALVCPLCTEDIDMRKPGATVGFIHGTAYRHWEKKHEVRKRKE
jgi:hypothetical protein